MSYRNIWGLDEVSMRQQKRRVQTVAFRLNSMKNDLILDMGCGEGFITSHISGAKVVGLDLSKAALLTAKHKTKSSDTEFIRADAAALPLKTASFDKILLLELLEHLFEEKERKVCGELDKVLKKNGVLLISAPYKERIVQADHTALENSPLLWGHVRYLDEDRITRLLPSTYSLVSTCNLPNIPFVSLSRIFQKLPFRTWLTLNNLLGKIRKGYWIIMEFHKKTIEGSKRGIVDIGHLG